MNRKQVIGGLAGLVFATIPLSVKAQQEQVLIVPDEAIGQVIPRQEPSVDDYIAWESGSLDTTKRNVYLIFQRHSIKDQGLSPEEEQESRVNAAESQTSVFRILEHLHKEKGLQTICAEHIDYNDWTDVVDAHMMERDPTGYKILSNVALSDKTLKQFFELSGLDAAPYVSLLNPDIYGLGFERPDPHDLPIGEELKKAKTQKEIGIVIGNMQAKAQLRSNCALHYGMQHADMMWGAGFARNRDVAIVIGLAHLPHFDQDVRATLEGRTDYDMSLIIPRSTLENLSLSTGTIYGPFPSEVIK